MWLPTSRPAAPCRQRRTRRSGFVAKASWHSRLRSTCLSQLASNKGTGPEQRGGACCGSAAAGVDFPAAATADPNCTHTMIFATVAAPALPVKTLVQHVQVDGTEGTGRGGVARCGGYCVGQFFRRAPPGCRGPVGPDRLHTMTFATAAAVLLDDALVHVPVGVGNKVRVAHSRKVARCGRRCVFSVLRCDAVAAGPDCAHTVVCAAAASVSLDISLVHVHVGLGRRYAPLTAGYGTM
jgi:hypothetical protein